MNTKAMTPARGVRHQDNGLEQSVEQSAELAAANAASKEQAEIQSAIIIAKKMPRNEAEAFQKLMRASQRPSFAEDANYTFPRGGQDVTGPSVNLAREAARVWGNIRHGRKVLREDDASRTIQGWAWDLETNTKIEAEDHFEKLIQRKNKVTKQTEWVEPDERDLRELTNRRGAILVRNCILQLLPKDLIEDALFECGKTLQSNAAKDPDATKKRLLSDFGRLNITVAMIESVLGHPLDQCTPKELADLRAVHNSIVAGNSTWSDYATSTDDTEQAASTATLNDQLRQQHEPAPASTSGVPPGQKVSAAPPGEPAQGGGSPNPLDLDDSMWSDKCLYLDADEQRCRVKNKAKAAVGLLPKDKIATLPREKRGIFLAEVLRLAKQDGVRIDL